jgi:predicted nucleotidyltransferase
MINPKRIADDLRELLPSAKAAWLYGSVARGEAMQSSDVDVAILFAEPTAHDAWQLSRDASVLSARWGKPVDLVNMRTAPCVLQNEIIQARHRLFASDVEKTDIYELFAMSQHRDYQERFAPDFERIARTGRVLERSHD